MIERWRSFLEGSLPEPWMRALAVLVVAAIAAAGLRMALTVSLVRWATRSKSDLDDQIAQALRRPLFLSVLLIGVAAAAILLQMPETAQNLVLRSTATVAVLMWMMAGFRVCHLLVRVFARVADRVSWIQPSTVPLVENLFRVSLVVVAAYFLLQAWELDVTPWLASAGVLGIALGFAAKDTLANLFGGFFIIIDAPYKIGDMINLDSGERGEVTRIGLRSTRILTRDDIEITIPNAQIANSKIINEDGGHWQKSRIRIKVGVAYGSELDQVRQALMEAAEIVPFCVNEPEPRVRLRAFGDSSLDYELLVWIERPEMRGRCIDALLSDIYVRFREAGIEIPFPQRDVHVRHLPAPGGTESPS